MQSNLRLGQDHIGKFALHGTQFPILARIAPCGRPLAASAAPANSKIAHLNQGLDAGAQILDYAWRSQYGPRGLEGAGNRIKGDARTGVTMVDEPRDEHDPAKRPIDEAALSARLRRLGDRLGHQPPSEDRGADRDRPSVDSSGFSRGMRLSSELVAGIIVGAAIGWAVDRLLGTSPWGLSIGLLLGFAGGVFNLVRATSGNTDRRS